MLSKVTSSLKWYAGAIAYGHLLLLMALFPFYFFVLFLLVLPSLWIFIAYYMLYNYAQREGIGIHAPKMDDDCIIDLHTGRIYSRFSRLFHFHFLRKQRRNRPVD